MEPTGNKVFLSRTYDEALSLVVEARDYVAHRERRDRGDLELNERMQASCETLRMTARLTRIVSWLMLQKAVFHGEITAEEAIDLEEPLSEEEVCLIRDHEEYQFLPTRLRDLLDRSLSLYTRVMRLEQDVVGRMTADQTSTMVN